MAGPCLPGPVLMPMIKRPKVPYAKGRKICIFCGATPITGEHVWPQWAHPIIPNAYGHARFEVHGNKRQQRQYETSRTERQGAVHKVKIRRACFPCNTGWMSRAEVRVRPFLEPMINGASITLTVEEQAHLAEYLTYKILILDWINEHPLLPIKHGHDFHKNRTKPPNLKIYLCNCMEGDWRSQFRSYELPLYPVEDFPGPDAPPTTKSFAIGIGNLFVFAITSFQADINTTFNSDSVINLWPLSGRTTHWPPQFPITSDQAEFIAHALWRFKGTPSDE
jgi:hypothetical protein